MSEAFDLEAAALKAEAEAAPFSFDYKGAHYEVPPMVTWPVEAVSMVADGDFRDALPRILGKDTAAELFSAGLTVGAMNILFEQMGREAGVDNLPNSGPPARRGSTRK